MRLPAVTFQIGLSDIWFTADLCWRIAFERSVKTVVVVINLERFKLSLQIDRVPEKRLVKKLSTNGVVVQRKFGPMLGRQLTGRCLCEPTSSERKCIKTQTWRASRRNESSRRLPMPKCPKTPGLRRVF